MKRLLDVLIIFLAISGMAAVGWFSGIFLGFYSGWVGLDFRGMGNPLDIYLLFGYALGHFLRLGGLFLGPALLLIFLIDLLEKTVYRLLGKKRGSTEDTGPL
jgi:hypothetical protein